MGRPWWYDDYWQKRKPPKRRPRLPGRRTWVWVAAVAIAVLITGVNISFRPALAPWIAGFVNNFCFVLTLAIFIRALLSWFVSVRYSLPVAILDDLTLPILTPLRRVIRPIGGFDFTPIAAVVILYLIPIIFDRILAVFVR